ncbi:MAG: siroheme synthase [Alphaproteobacteria bacterium]|nr:siroheme synthase [Alphaproteobacteria bacterium]
MKGNIMLPIVLDVKRLKMAVIGRGALALRRLHMLDEAGCAQVQVFCPPPTSTIKEGEQGDEMDKPLHEQAGERLLMRAPEADEIAALAVLFIAGLPTQEAAPFADMARAQGVLVNVEDVTDYCDFHVPAQVRRGALLLSASTGGQSPALARRLKDFLSARFPAIWRERLEELATQRTAWRKQGLSSQEIAEQSNQFIDARQWLTCPCPLADKRTEEG